MAELTITPEEVTERRTALGLSKAALAREANLNTATVSQIENKRLVAYPGQVKKLVAAFERLEAQQAAM